MHNLLTNEVYVQDTLVLNRYKYFWDPWNDSFDIILGLGGCKSKKKKKIKQISSKLNIKED